MFPVLYSTTTRTQCGRGAEVPTAAEDASKYTTQFRRSGQFVLSRTNHHIHLPDSKTGVRMPLNACIAKGQKKKNTKECKHGAPWTKQCTRRTKVVCHGVAKKHFLKTSGQRNALGSFLVKRHDEWSYGSMYGSLFWVSHGFAERTTSMMTNVYRLSIRTIVLAKAFSKSVINYFV